MAKLLVWEQIYANVMLLFLAGK